MGTSEGESLAGGGQAEVRRLVLLAGPSSSSRAALAQRLAERGLGALFCAVPWENPGSCPLCREDRCALARAADAVVIFAPATARGLASPAVSACTRAAPRVLVAGFRAFDLAPRGAVLAPSTDPDDVADAVATLLSGRADGTVARA